MNLKFQYEKEKDIWCILNKGKSSINSQSPTKQYEQLVELHGNIPSIEVVASFIDTYLSEKDISIEKYIEMYQNDWDSIADEYAKRAERIFCVSLPEDVMVYLTINSRCPYSLEENYFFVMFPVYPYLARRIAMHELWHFYTWYAFGPDQEEKLGKQKYNDLKEALTVLLNVECNDLLHEGVIDEGYPQHAELRGRIIELWNSEKNIHKVWDALIEE